MDQGNARQGKSFSGSLILLAVLSMGTVFSSALIWGMELQDPGSAARCHEAHTEHQSACPVTPVTSDRNYSLFMHHASGIVVLILGTLIVADRLVGDSSRVIRVSIGSVWILLGVFLVIWADPEGWPIGPAGFVESFTMPTAGEWMQHKLLSLIPVLLGIFWLTSSDRASTPLWNYGLAVVSVLGALGLLRHQHAAHPGMDTVNVQHRLFAGTALFIAAALIIERRDGWMWKYKRFIVPTGLLLLGSQLVLFRE